MLAAAMPRAYSLRMLEGALSGAPRRARQSDVPAIAAVLTRAFQNDPVACWACRSERRRPQVLQRFFTVMANMLIAQEEVWTLPAHEGAAIWAPPGDWRVGAGDLWPLARALAFPSVAWRLPLVGFGLGRVELRHPRRPHFYLADLGTDPSHQGKGVGSALLAPVLATCDLEGVGAYLESSSERNLDFYARHGFRLRAELRLPRGPTVYPMWRDPVN